MINKYWKDIVLVLMAIVIVILGYFTWHSSNEKIKDPVIVTSQQASDPQYLQKEVKIPQSQTKEVVKYVEKAQAGTATPHVTFNVQAATPADAAVQVQQRIEKKDDTLPAAALEETDRTIIAEQPDNPEQSVGVYKINLRKNHAVKAGVAYIDDETYWTASYRNRKLEYTVMGQDSGIKGGMVQYTVAEW